MKYSIAHYQKIGTDYFINGGKLIITDSEYILKCFFKTVAKFNIEETTISKIPENLFYQGIRISDDKMGYNLYFFPKTASEIYKQLNIE